MKPITIIYNYQTLISGLLAVVGAITTVFFINRQIRQANSQETERRRRSDFAARAMMPAALSELCQYSQKCASALVPLIENAPTTQVSVSASIRDFPAIPDDALLVLRECIEFGSEAVAENIADLIRKLQVQSSRLGGEVWLSESGNTIVPPILIDCVLDALEIYARSTSLFPYARREQDDPPSALNTDNFKSAAHNCGIWNGMGNPEIFSAIEHRFNRGIVHEERPERVAK